MSAKNVPVVPYRIASHGAALALIVTVVAMAAACGGAAKPHTSGAPPAWARTAHALLEPTASTAAAGDDARGRVKIVEGKDGVTITILVAGVAAGEQHVSIVDEGGCAAAADAVAGAVPAATDLGRVRVGKNGTGEVELVVPGATLGQGETSLVGRAIVLHAAGGVRGDARPDTVTACALIL